MNGNVSKSKILFVVAVFVLVIQAAVSLFFNTTLALVQAIVAAVFALYVLFCRKAIKKTVSLAVLETGDIFCNKNFGNLNRIEMPVMVSNKSGEVVWYNRAFDNTVACGTVFVGKTIYEMFSNAAAEELLETGNIELSLNNKRFNAFAYAGEGHNIFFLSDQTLLKQTEREYYLARPAVAVVLIDNFDEISKSSSSSERSVIKGRIFDEIEKWFAVANGIVMSTTSDRMLLVFEQRYLQKFIDEKFCILDSVRNMQFANGKTATLSMGVAYGASGFGAARALADSALDMALGRGGDQVAIKAPDKDYRFFGGVKSAPEKNSQVRTRIMAANLKGLIEGSERVLIMGHKYADLDSVGACYALYSVVRAFGKPAHIVCNTKAAAGISLVEYIEKKDADVEFCDAEGVIPFVDRKTLLIVVDTHRAVVVDYPQVLQACKSVVVIDHHRKSEDYIKDTLAFYHETGASSACEMVTELIKFMAPATVAALQADCLLSGIMLDTKNFVFNTGVRTFEAAAWLRSRGADTVAVKKLFAGSFENYRQRSAVVANAQVVMECAISVNTVYNANTRVATAQAADDMLNISGIKGAFALCSDNGGINISARSMGDMNVQVIMEKLGGGGHRNMAACQLATADFEQAKARLLTAIKEYYSDMKGK